MASVSEQLKVPEAAAYLGISRSSLYRLVGRRLIKRTKVKGIVRFPRRELDAFIERFTREAR